jgi:peptidoglycan hydrolase-like protein with peptidoglycan-binding domain
MPDTKVGGQTSTIPLSTTTATETSSEAPKVIENKQTISQESANTVLAQKMQATENKGQQILTGKLLQNSLYQALPSATPTAAAVPSQASGSPQPVVKDLQESLNKWRAENGKTPIKEDGIDSEDTRKAVREFQRENGIKEDGVAGPETRKKLSIQVDIIAFKNDPKTAADMRRLSVSEGFTKLPTNLQSEVMDRFKKYAAAGELPSIGNMVNVIDQPGFGNLPLSTRKLFLDTMAARPDDDKLATNLSNMAGFSGFVFLDEKSQNWVLNKIQSYGGDRNKIVSLIILADQTTPNAVGKPAEKNELLTRLMNYPPDPDQVENLVKLPGRGLRNLPEDVQKQILDGLPYRFGTGQMTGNGADNLMTLASAPHFQKLSPDKRDEMMNLLALRQDNAELANALRELAEDQRFQLDNRTWRQTLDKVDAGIH